MPVYYPCTENGCTETLIPRPVPIDCSCILFTLLGPGPISWPPDSLEPPPSLHRIRVPKSPPTITAIRTKPFLSFPFGACHECRMPCANPSICEPPVSRRFLLSPKFSDWRLIGGWSIRIYFEEERVLASIWFDLIWRILISSEGEKGGERRWRILEKRCKRWKFREGVGNDD